MHNETFGMKWFCFRAKMDLELVPIKLQLAAFAEVWFFGYRTVWKGTLWQYKAPTIRYNIFDVKTEDKDESPPEILPNTYNKRHKLQVNRGCMVEQLSGRDYTDTAFMIEVNFQDPVSNVKLHYAIGDHSGGSNLVDWTEMSGTSIVVPQKLPGGVPLYWSVKGKNDQGGEAITTCSLPTYDNTLPDGRLEASYEYSSHPHKISGTLILVDDSELIPVQEKAVGFGKGMAGSEVVRWQQFSPDKVSINHDAKDHLEHFSVPRRGKLTSEPIKTSNEHTDSLCAKRCLDFGTKCVSFDYDHEHGSCDLQAYLEGPDTHLRLKGGYHNYERIGVGHTALLEYEKLPLEHGEVYYINTKITNKLGYVSFISSQGTLIDFTPPEPGPIGNASYDKMKADGCSAAITQRCIDPTWHPNHR